MKEGKRRIVLGIIAALAIVSATVLYVFVVDERSRHSDSRLFRPSEARDLPAQPTTTHRVPIASGSADRENIGLGDGLLRADSPSPPSDGFVRLQEIRDEFFAETDPKDLDLTNGNSAHNSVFQFYLSQLRSNDKEIRDAVFNVFAAVYGDPSLISFRTGPREITETPDLRILANMLRLMWETLDFTDKTQRFHEDTGIMRDDSALMALWGNKGFYELAELVIPYLDDPERAGLASGILNSLTGSTYEDKDSDWWKNNFANSTIAGLLQGVPDRDWKSRPE